MSAVVEPMGAEGDERRASELLASDLAYVLRLDRQVDAVSGLAGAGGQGLEYW
jgi:hypothetical protein